MHVTFEERPALHGMRIAIVTLDAAQQLNALSLPMIDALLDQLGRWANEPAVACVLLRGNGAVPRRSAPVATYAALQRPAEASPERCRPWPSVSLPTSTASSTCCTITRSR